ncbi:hypothetical protein F5884DRAFT_682416 [Xylogone sp. PMI_703]|nr:hypothetical protein F5884DRAFT_682416 [Xylogone sp. PMI_703]
MFSLRVARWVQLGSLKKFQLDDGLMLLVVVTFTGVVVSTNEVATHESNYLPPEELARLTPDEVKSAIWGSKMNLVLEEFTLTTIWLIKACILIMYSRLTMGLGQHFAVKCVGWYCAFGYVLVQVLYLAVWCRPIQQYWAVPVRDEQCASYRNHMITATVFNVSSDLMMLLIPLPLLITSRLPLKRKLVLCCVFGLGIFVILAAILNRYYNFHNNYSLIFLNWYVGEVATAVFVGNIPLCWPLLRRIFALGTFRDSKRSRSNTNSNYNNQPRSSAGLYGLTTSRQRRDRLSLASESRSGPGESEERIAGCWTTPGMINDQTDLVDRGPSLQVIFGQGSDKDLNDRNDDWYVVRKGSIAV